MRAGARYLAALFLAAFVVAVAVAQEHVVRPGDTLYDLARHYDTDVATLRSLNEIEGDMLRVGSFLQLPGAAGWREERVARGVSWRALAERVGRSEEALRRANPDQDTPSGHTVRIPPGEGPLVWVREGEDLLVIAGRADVAPGTLTEANGLSPPYHLEAGTPLMLPEGTRRAAARTAEGSGAEGRGGAGAMAGAPSPRASVSHQEMRRVALAALPEMLNAARLEPPEKGFEWPLAGPPRITSRFGWRALSVLGNRYHQGIDLGAALGTPVRAARDGEVIRAGWLGAYGYAVYLRHAEGYETRYAHMQGLAVRVGQRVQRGAVVGRVGSTGASTGPHLHFETRLGASALDPLEVLPPGSP